VLLAGCANMKGIEPQAKLRDAGRPAADATARRAGRQPSGGASSATRSSTRWSTRPCATIRTWASPVPRLRRAQPLEVAGAATQPQVNGAGPDAPALYRERPGAAAAGRLDPNTGTLQLGASWEIDFFGKNKAALEAALGAARAAQADVDAARVVLASNVARSYFQLVRLHEQLAVASARWRSAKSS
jgi:outer membrane protein TolC